MKALFVDFEGNPTKAKLSALDKMLAAHGMVKVEATIEMPKPKAKSKAKAEQPKPVEPESTPESTPEPKADTRLEAKEESKPKRRSGFPPNRELVLKNATFLAMIETSNGLSAVGIMEGPSKNNKYSLGYVNEKKNGDVVIKTNGRLWREESEIIGDWMEPTVENARKLIAKAKEAELSATADELLG